MAIVATVPGVDVVAAPTPLGVDLALAFTAPTTAMHLEAPCANQRGYVEPTFDLGIECYG